MTLPLIFALVAAAGVAAYVLADGFDLGIGILFLLAPRDQDRNVMMDSIAPFWDGNETWLVFGGSLLLAAFPAAYYVLLPAFYLPVMLMLFSLIIRGVAFEFRFKASRFQRVWDYTFAAGSLLATLSQGLILGGFINGVPMKDGAFSGGPFAWVTLLGLACGAGLVGGYALLGAGWLITKTDGATQVFAREVGRAALILTLGVMLAVSGWTALTQPEVATRWFAWPWVLPESLLPLGAGAVGVLIWRNLWSMQEWIIFRLAIILFLLGFAGLTVSLFPYVVPRHVTIWDGAGDPVSLRFLGVGMVIILPIILAYLCFAYWVFRGKTALGSGEEVADSTSAVAARRASASAIDLHLS